MCIEFDYFYKTSSSENIAFVQDVFKKLNDSGHIYEKEIIQFYCNNHEKCINFRNDRIVVS